MEVILFIKEQRLFILPLYCLRCARPWLSIARERSAGARKPQGRPAHRVTSGQADAHTRRISGPQARDGNKKCENANAAMQHARFNGLGGAGGGKTIRGPIQILMLLSQPLKHAPRIGSLCVSEFIWIRIFSFHRG